jgi:hypothetical protein
MVRDLCAAFEEATGKTLGPFPSPHLISAGLRSIVGQVVLIELDKLKTAEPRPGY